jgi:hypothetical protein
MTSTSIGVRTGTENLHVTMRDTPSLRSATGFGEVFRDLDSLMFVCALQEALEPPRSPTGIDWNALKGKTNPLFADPNFLSIEGDPWHSPIEYQLYLQTGMISRLSRRPDIAIFGGGTSFGTDAPDPVQLRSETLIASAKQVAREIQVQRVSYQSPLEIVLAWATEVAQSPGFSIGSIVTYSAGGTGALYVVNRAIKLWGQISGARMKHSEANKAACEAKKAAVAVREAETNLSLKGYDAREKDAEARMKEADAKLRESLVGLKLEAHELIRSDLKLAQVFLQAESPTDPSAPQRTAALLQTLDQAANSLASIEDMKIIES